MTRHIHVHLHDEPRAYGRLPPPPHKFPTIMERDGLIGSIHSGVVKATGLVTKGANLVEKHRPHSISDKLQRLHERRTGHKNCDCQK